MFGTTTIQSKSIDIILKPKTIKEQEGERIEREPEINRIN